MPSYPSKTTLALLLGPNTAFLAPLRGVSWVLAHSEETDRSAATAVIAREAPRRPPPATASSPFGPGVVTPRRSRPPRGDEAKMARNAAALCAPVVGLPEKQMPGGERARYMCEQAGQHELPSTPTQWDPRHRMSGATCGLVRSRRSRLRTAESVPAQGAPTSEESLVTSWGLHSPRESQRPSVDQALRNSP